MLYAKTIYLNIRSILNSINYFFKVAKNYMGLFLLVLQKFLDDRCV